MAAERWRQPGSDYGVIRHKIEQRTQQREERRHCTDVIVTTIESYFSDEQNTFEAGRDLKYSLKLLLADLRAVQEEVTPQLSAPIQVDFTAILQGRTQEYKIIFSVIAEADKIYLRQRQDQPNAVTDNIFPNLDTW